MTSRLALIVFLGLFCGALAFAGFLAMVPDFHPDEETGDDMEAHRG